MVSKKETLNAAAEKLNTKKLRVADSVVPDKKMTTPLRAGINAAIAVNILGFALGTLAYSGAKMPDFDKPVKWEDREPGITSAVYGELSYGQALKNAYLLDDMVHGRGGVFQGICGILVTLLSLGAGVGMYRSTISDRRRHQQDRHILLQRVVDNVDALKNWVSIDKDILRRILDSLDGFATELVTKMSELDRDYLDSLVSGRMNGVSYNIASAIIAGHLKSHPEDYVRLVSVIDEATLPQDIVKKYGRGKTVSFGAARAMKELNRSKD